MFLLKQILPAAVISMLAAAAICGLALCWGKERARPALAAVALGAAYFTGHLFVAGWAKFPPADTTNWLPYFALLAAVMGAFCGVLTIKTWTRVLIFGLVSAGALRLLLKPKFQYTWSSSEGWLWVACLTSALVLLAVILDRLLGRPETRIEAPAFLLVTCAGTCGALMLSGSMLLGQFAAVLAAAVVGTLILASRNVAAGRGIVPVSALLLGALLVSGCFFAELPAASAVLLGFAPALALIPVGNRNKLVAFGLRGTFVSVPVVVALVLAFRSSPPLDY